MGEARHTILVKSAQMQRMNSYFQHDNLMDTININHFSGSVSGDYHFNLLEQ